MKFHVYHGLAKKSIVIRDLHIYLIEYDNFFFLREIVS